MADAPGPERCDECGFAYDLGRVGESSRAITAAAAEVATLVVRDPRAAAGRPSPGTWSALEYACHLRDVLIVQRERVLLARRVDAPAPEPMGRDERAEHDGYAEQAPTDVARQLVDAGALFVNALARLSPADWDRTMIYNYPVPTPRSLRWVAVHTEHEARHHLGDVRAQLGPA
jgi:hypothetical protein